ncbi:MAG: FtsX-like permease family protein, partial [Comamonas sp.]
IYISALIAGLQANTVAKTLGTQAHLTLRAPDDRVLPALPREPGAAAVSETQPRAQRLRSVANWQLLLPQLQALPGVSAVSPMVSGAGLALRGEATQAIALMGVDLERYRRIIDLDSKITSGRLQLAPGEAMVGVELAADLGLRAGDRFTIDTGSATESVRVSALLDLGVKDLNRRSVLVPLRSAQSLLGLPGGATVLELQLADVWQAQDMARQLRQTYPYRVESWQDNNAQLLSALAAQSISTAVFAVVLAVVVLGIASVLVVSVVQKRREIGILRAMGATRGQIARVFLLQGAMVGALGSLLGLLFAALLIWAFMQFVRGPDGGPVFAITLSLPTMLQVSLLATVCGVLAAVAPARRAAAMDPAQAIRI